MKKNATYLLVILCLLLTATVSTSLAQEQKIGYVNTNYILSKLPEYKGIHQQLQTISSEWNSELKTLKREIKHLKEDYEAKEILYTDEMREQKQQEIQNKIQQRQQFVEQKFGAEGEYFQQQKKLLEPVQRKVMNAINRVANRQNFDFIFDRAQKSGMLFGSRDWNLNDEVLQELGITLNDSSN